MYRLTLFLFLGLSVFLADFASAQDPQTIVEDCLNYIREQASISELKMTIHRPDWQRSMEMKAYTRGKKDALVTILAPAKDKGNGTLNKAKGMWIFNPRINRVIKVPPSMMAQSWMGSDFSNNDLAKSDSLAGDYTHELTGTEIHEGKRVYLITAIPKPDAPVVWGLQKLKIREDRIILSQAFFDESHQLVKTMTTDQIQLLGGKLFPKVWRMQKAETGDEYTELQYISIEFLDNLPDHLMTLARLKNPGR